MEKLLPPGLFLPTAEEDPSKYELQYFRGPNPVEDWRLVDYGAFVTSLVAFDAAAGNRLSLMPNRNDFRAIHEAGYGPTVWRIQRTMGIVGVQQSLGFYPRNYRPDQNTILERYEWIQTNIFDPHNMHKGAIAVRPIVEWCTDRDLAPHLALLQEIFDGDIDPVRKIFGIRKRSPLKDSPYTELFKLGAQIMHDHGSMLPSRQFNTGYRTDSGVQPVWAADRLFGGANKFWLEFGQVRDTSGLSLQDFVNVGTRYAIRSGDRELARKTVKEKSAEKRLPTGSSLTQQAGGLPAYREMVNIDLALYDKLVMELDGIGVLPEVTQIFCGKFEPTEEFRNWLISGKDVLAAFTENYDKTTYVRKIINQGFNLLDDEIFDLQLMDFMNELQRIGIDDRENVRFVLGAVPCVNADEILNKFSSMSGVNRAVRKKLIKK